MELSEHGLLEDLLAPRRDIWENSVPENLFSNNGYSIFDCLDDSYTSTVCGNAFYPDEFISNPLQHQDFNIFSSNEVYCQPFADDFFPPLINDLAYGTPPFPVNEEFTGFIADDFHNFEKLAEANCKEEPINGSPEASIMPTFNMGSTNCAERKNTKSKKLQGQPSKNLMAERRRRKRLNDRLTMLRSIVPKISKMDRTSILGDTIDYMKELLDRINNLQQEIEATNSEFDMGIFNDVKPNEALVRNAPKFDVERRNSDTRIEISCPGKPGLLLTTVNTLESLGLDIQQCVISCFNDFAMQASCSEKTEQRTLMSSDDIKQELFTNAGYGGRCL
ncbi:transcription factor bHLH93-like [Rutidosis leptorrhynchoides]|uniref:transcription factor bHLH93-like n=1 Tax=Rutidosis leptorrhynchoides TaxID=125765 RepID=UPI003A99A669